MTDITADWFWEGQVVGSLVKFLIRDGWLIRSQADTHSKERGADIHAAKREIELFVEAKGYPSKFYRDPRRASEQKPTNPTNQAQQWYSHALLKALRLQNEHASAIIALAFPDFPRYRALLEETSGALRKLGIVVYLTRETGEVLSFAGSSWGAIKSSQ